MMQGRFPIFSFVAAAMIAMVLGACEKNAPTSVVIEQEPSVDALVATVLNGGGTFRDVEFQSLIATSTGHQVIPFDPNDPVDQEIYDGIRTALGKVLTRFNQADSPTSAVGRINEVSGYFEDALREEIDRMPELNCEIPRTAAGNLQRVGYPDLIIHHQASGRVAYLDPKLVEQGSLTSSLRTFYFTPKTETNKVLHDAHHLLVGIEHDGKVGAWRFLRWHLVDLTRFKITLKAEFQAGNAELYRPDLIIGTGE